MSDLDDDDAVCEVCIDHPEVECGRGTDECVVCSKIVCGEHKSAVFDYVECQNCDRFYCQDCFKAKSCRFCGTKCCSVGAEEDWTKCDVCHKPLCCEGECNNNIQTCGTCGTHHCAYCTFTLNAGKNKILTECDRHGGRRRGRPQLQASPVFQPAPIMPPQPLPQQPGQYPSDLDPFIAGALGLQLGTDGLYHDPPSPKSEVRKRYRPPLRGSSSNNSDVAMNRKVTETSGDPPVSSMESDEGTLPYTPAAATPVIPTVRLSQMHSPHQQQQVPGNLNNRDEMMDEDETTLPLTQPAMPIAPTAHLSQMQPPQQQAHVNVGDGDEMMDEDLAPTVPLQQNQPQQHQVQNIQQWNLFKSAFDS
jgi:hypothetical protein